MDDAELAYEAAQAEIARVKAAGGDTLVLAGWKYQQLNRLPPEISELKSIRRLILGSHPITNGTDFLLHDGKWRVGDKETIPSSILDLRPVMHLDQLTDGAAPCFSFKNVPATNADKRLWELAQIEDHADRARQTLDYLRSLPPWPEPYTPAATPDGSPPKPIGGMPERAKIKTAQTQIQHLIRNATVTRVTAQAFASQIEEALRNVPATHGNQLAEPLQTMQEFAVALRNLAPPNEPASDPLQRAQLELRISQLEALVDRLTRQLADETKAREAAEALAKKEGFWSNYKQGAGKAAGVATVSLATVGVPTAAVFFLGVEHPLVQAFLTVMGRLPKS